VDLEQEARTGRGAELTHIRPAAVRSLIQLSNSQRSAARFREGAGCPVPFSCSPKGEMERREAPGRCATAPLWGAGALCRTPQRALQGRDCESHPEAHAGGDLKACEASPPNRCASRRSTGRSRIAPRPAPGAAGLISGPAARPTRLPRRFMRAARPASGDTIKVRADSAAGITFFTSARPSFETVASRPPQDED